MQARRSNSSSGKCWQGEAAITEERKSALVKGQRAGLCKVEASKMNRKRKRVVATASNEKKKK